MTPLGIRNPLNAALVLCACAAFSGSLPAQTVPATAAVTIRMYDARTGKQLRPDNFVVRFDHQDDVRNESLKIDDEGTGQINVPVGVAVLAVEGTFNASMEIYINCDTGKEKNDPRRHWYGLPTILSTGVIAPNECFNGKYEHPRIDVKPGEFLFYVRQHNWRDPSSY